MTGRPAPDEFAPYYATYTDRISSGDILAVLESQITEARTFYGTISEERSLYRYALGKWSIRESLSHVNDTERVFAYRAFWFARGFGSALPSFEQETAAASAGADAIPLAAHLDEFEEIRRTTLRLYRNLPEEAWMRSGIASNNKVTARALAYIIAGHAAHHGAIVRECYL